MLPGTVQPLLELGQSEFLQVGAGSVSRTHDRNFDSRRRVLSHVRNAAQKTGRTWALSFDIAGAPADRIFDLLTTEWRRLVDEGMNAIADAYKARIVAQAQGDAQRFRSVLAEYQKAPQVTRDRMYLDAMQQIYGNVPRRGDLKQRWWPTVKPLKASQELSYSDPKVRQPEWTRYWQGVSYGDEDSEALQVGLTILAGGRTSRLYHALVEQGEAVMVYGSSMEMEAPGVVMINATPSDGVSIEELQLSALSVVDKFLKDGPTDAELVRAKNMIAADATFSRDNQMGMADWYGSQLTAGLPLPYIEAWEDRVRAVTAADVKLAMSRYVMGKPFIDAFLLPEDK